MVIGVRMKHRILIPAFALLICSTPLHAQTAESLTAGAAPAAGVPAAAAAAALPLQTSLLIALGAGVALAGAGDPSTGPLPKGNLTPGEDRPYRPGLDPDSDSISDTSIGTFPGTF